MNINKKMGLGLVAMTLLAAACLYASDLLWFKSHGISALILAIVVGMVLGNVVASSWQQRLEPGVGFAKHYALRLGIVLYGFNITFQDVLSIGWAGVLTDVVVILTVFFTGLLVGTRVFKMETNEAALIGAGSAVCGAAAVLATAPVIKAKSEHIAVAVATVVVFGTISIFLHPVLLKQMIAWGWIDGQPLLQGLFIGSSVHEVAQVVAIGKAIDPQTAQMAVIVKMVRVMMLAPFLMMVMWVFSRHASANTHATGEKTAITIPWFAFGFIAVARLNSLHLLPVALVQAIQAFDVLLLCVAMVALGFTTRISVIKKAGVKPILLASVLFVLLLSLSTLSVYLLNPYY